MDGLYSALLRVFADFAHSGVDLGIGFVRISALFRFIGDGEIVSKLPEPF
jgi:hypothetical protein